MTAKEKLELIEKVLYAAPNSFTVDTALNTIKTWDSLNILNLQIELSALRPDLQFDDLYSCKTVGDICSMI